MRILLAGIPSDTLQNMEFVEAPHCLPQCVKPLAGEKADVVMKAERISNTGNYLIGEGILHVLREHEVTYVAPWKIPSLLRDADFVRYINEQFDYVAISTANMIRSDYKPTTELDLLKAINLPVFLIGVGIQRRDDLERDIPAETLEFIGEIAKREHTVFTRGTESESFLRNQGLRNVVATGCPSLYLAPSNIKESLRNLKNLDLASCQNIALNGYLGKDLSVIEDVNSLTTPQHGSFHYVCQDEFLHYGLEIDSSNTCFDAIKHEFVGRLEYQGKKFLKSPLKVYVFHSTSTWRTWSNSMDLTLGYRFHGNLIAMQTSIPSVIISVDDRMREMLKISGLPYIEMEEWYSNDDRRGLINKFTERLSLDESLDCYEQANERFINAMKTAGILS